MEKTVKAWAILKDKALFLIWPRPEMDCQVYLGLDGTAALREDLEIVPCTITYTA